MASSPMHVAILASPGMGHLIPLVEFARRLLSHFNVSSTLITFSNFSSPSMLTLLSSLPPSISSVSLPPLPLSHLPPSSRVETFLLELISLSSSSSLKPILQSLQHSSNLVAYVIDLFGVNTLHVAKELNIPSYMLCTSNFFFLSFMLRLPELNDSTSCEFRELPEPLELPGCVPLRGEDFIDPVQDRVDEACRRVVEMARKFVEPEGILVNSFEALEPETARVFREGGFDNKIRIPPVYPVGPIRGTGSAGDHQIQNGGGGGDGSECLDWLDGQPAGSVLFVSFGSGGTLTCEQVRELALGLEESKQRFLWVLRAPQDPESASTFLGVASSHRGPLDYLPEGFLERTRELGLVVPNWAPQVEVLGHVAVGGFVSHCGWNSTLESVMSGVPMIAWPLYAEQRMNAVMLVAQGVALRAEGATNGGVVQRAEVRAVVAELMEGEKGKAVREKVMKLKAAGEEALEKGGSSYKGLEEVVNKWKSAAQ